MRLHANTSVSPASLRCARILPQGGAVHSIIHRDLKSSNLLIANDQSKTVKICDFSFSRLSQGRYEITGVGLGTPGWVPPVREATSGLCFIPSLQLADGWFAQEETMGELVTAKADVYSFAMIMWELLQSEIPYADLLFGESVPESLRKQVPNPQLLPLSVRSRLLCAGDNRRMVAGCG